MGTPDGGNVYLVVGWSFYVQPTYSTHTLLLLPWSA